MEVTKKVHALFTFRYYPRVYYYHKRAQDLHTRFTQLKGVFPEKINNKDIIEEIDNDIKTYSKPPKLLVYSNSDLQLSQLVFSMAPEKEIIKQNNGNGVDIVVFYIRVESPEDQLKQIAEQVIHSYTTTDGTLCPERMFVMCKIDNCESISDLEIKGTITSVLQSHLHTHHAWDDQIIVAPSDEKISDKISNYMERAILTSFEKIKLYLERFITKGQGQVQGEIFDQESVKECLAGFVSNKWHIIDVIQKYDQDVKMAAQTSSLSEDDRHLVYIVEELVNITKCAIANPLSLKYQLPQTLCDDMLNEMGATNKLKKSLSLSTKSIMKRLFRFREFEVGYRTPAKTTRHEYMVEKIQNDFSTAMKEIEQLLTRTREMTVIMERMIFEIGGYFKQSVIWKKEQRIPSPRSYDKMRKALFSRVDNVYGVGTFYGQLEIHVTKEDAEAEVEIRDILREYSYFRPYTIKIVEKQPTNLADMQHEHGKALYTCTHAGERDVKGTLGVFVENGTKESLYALTCAHVVRLGASNNDRNVYIEERQRHRVLGVSSANMALFPGEEKGLDIAAVKIADDIRNNCVRFLKDDDGMNRRSHLAEQEDIAAYEALYVYKFGAASDLTKGLVCSNDYMMQVNQQTNMPMFVVWIDSLPALVQPFAKRGDSGSVVCLPTPGDENITTLSMIQAGDFKLQGEPSTKCLTFLLQSGLESLSRKAGVNLFLCS